MKKTISAVAVVAISMAISGAAAGQGRSPEMRTPATMNAPSTTLTGCVARGAAGGSYTLAEEKKATATTADATASPELLALSGTDVDMSKHVGHKVTVTGSYANAGSPAGTRGTEKPAASDTADATKKATKTFTVKSLKMVAAACGTATD